MKIIAPAAAAALAVSLLAGTAALAQTPASSAPNSLHIRGSVQSVKNNVLTVSSASGPVRVQLAAQTPVVSVIPSDRSKVKEGAFVGIASVPGPGGAQQAREVVIFPEAARGTGEGSYAWDLPGTPSGASKMTNGKVGGGSKMTNGTVRPSKMTNGTVGKSKMTNGTVKNATGGTSELTLEFKSGTGKGTQKLTLPAGIPFVTFEPGKRTQLAPGAHVVVFAHRGASGVAADRVLVGKNGLVPPM